MARRATTLLAGGALLAALALVAAGCGSSKAANTAATTTTTTGRGGTARAAALQAFSQCLRRHGINAPRFGGGARPPTSGRPRQQRPSGGFGRNLSPAQQTAFTACRSKLPSGGFGFRPGNGGGGNRNPAVARYTSCLRKHGVTFGKTASAQTFQKAQKACAKYRPSA